MTDLTADEIAQLRGLGQGQVPAVVARIVRDRETNATARAVVGFSQWIAVNRAYNGSEHRHGQTLYNECVNSALSAWAVAYVAEELKR